MKQIGFIGLGVMGGSMAAHLIEAGYRLNVYNRTQEKAAPLVERGASLCGTPAACAADMDAVITIVGYPQDVEQVYFGENGIFAAAKKGALLIDMTTTDPQLSVRIAHEAQARGMQALDAPVSGGDVGARNATLSIMCGGDADAFARAQELFAHLGKNAVHTGGPGSGQHTKMCNQIAIAGAIAGVCEALSYGQRAGLDLQRMLACIGAGAANSWQLQNYAPRILEGDLAPGFMLRHQLKDLVLAAQNAKVMGADLPVLEIVRELYEQLDAQGFGGLGSHALIKAYGDLA